jgi:hypothetical protein
MANWGRNYSQWPFTTHYVLGSLVQEPTTAGLESFASPAQSLAWGKVWRQ